MKVVVILFLAAVALGNPARPLYSLDKAGEHFQQFVETYNKQYASEAEKARRLEIFKHNLDLINQKNAESKTAEFGITLFSDLSAEEFIERHTGLRGGVDRRPSDCSEAKLSNATAPDKWDWRQKGIISDAKDQQNCGSCWAFSAIANVEAQYAKKHKKLLDLSEQQLVDCDKISHGCEGTWRIANPFIYMKDASGVNEEKVYPYKHKKQDCKFDHSNVKAEVKDCVNYSPKTEEELKALVYHTGPVSIGLDASALQFYERGILQNCPYVRSNHAVLLAGYGEENDVPYWVIKNSWGMGYGEEGFVRIKQGIDACGLMESEFVQAVVE